jgi:hypothetical protein
MSPARWIPILALAASLAAPLDAAACGGCFHGPATVQVLLDTFKSVAGIRKSKPEALVAAVGAKKADAIRLALGTSS